jgi:hypothetical protein
MAHSRFGDARIAVFAASRGFAVTKAQASHREAKDGLSDAHAEQIQLDRLSVVRAHSVLMVLLD